MPKKDQPEAEGPQPASEPQIQPQAETPRAETPRADAAPRAASRSRGASLEPATVTPRREQYLIGQQAKPGVQPLDLNLLEQTLNANPEIEVVKRLTPPGIAGVLATGPAGGPQAIIVARMAEDHAQNLQRSARGALVVEPDHPLTFALPDATATEMKIRDPGVVTPSEAGFTAFITVTGKGGAPVEGAQVYLFGTFWPGQGVTNAAGEVELELAGESPATIKALYVKPKLDPMRNNIIALTPLEDTNPGFPGQQVLGWGQKAMRLDQVPAEFRGQGIKIAVVDSGAAITHQDLKARVKGGFDVAAGNDRTWSEDTVMHGTHCIGVIAGDDNGIGIRGFAPDADVWANKIFPGGRFSDLIDALNRCIEQQVDLVNLSLGTDQRSQLVEQKLREAKEMGIACIVAAGNSGGAVQYPAASAEVLAVAAIGRQGAFPADSYHTTQVTSAVSGEGYFSAKFTCFGPEVGVCAPGVAILSSVPPNNYAAWDGTSMAAPHVCGLAALILAHHPDFQERFKARNAQRVERLFQILKQSCVPLNFGDRNRTGAGMPDAVRALNVQTATTTPLPIPPLPPDVLQKLLNAIQEAAGARTPAGASTATTPAQPKPDPLTESMRRARLLSEGEPSIAPLGLGGPQAPAPDGDTLTAAMLKAHLLGANGGQAAPQAAGPSGASGDPLREAMEKAGLLR